MKWTRLLIVVLAMTSWSCETLKNKGDEGDPAKPTRLSDIDTSDLPEEYVPGLRPVIQYYVDAMENSLFTFEDAIGDYRVMLYADHGYRFIATAKDKSKSNSRQGLWKWHRVGPDQGFLIMDDRRWFLNFTTLEEASATTSGDQRNFVLNFSRM
jgi:hypothetical protein